MSDWHRIDRLLNVDFPLVLAIACLALDQAHGQPDSSV
jgi:hypothetical protein